MHFEECHGRSAKLRHAHLSKMPTVITANYAKSTHKWQTLQCQHPVSLCFTLPISKAKKDVVVHPFSHAAVVLF